MSILERRAGAQHPGANGHVSGRPRSGRAVGGHSGQDRAVVCPGVAGGGERRGGRWDAVERDSVADEAILDVVTRSSLEMVNINIDDGAESVIF